jgi:hypothetical protein
VLQFPPPRYNWNIVESGVKHHNPTHLMTNWNNKVSLMPISTIPEKNYSPLTSDWRALSPLATRFIYDLWILLLMLWARFLLVTRCTQIQYIYSGGGVWYLMTISTIFHYIVAVCFIVGGNRSTRRKPQTCQTLSHNVVWSTPRREQGSNSHLLNFRWTDIWLSI